MLSFEHTWASQYLQSDFAFVSKHNLTLLELNRIEDLNVNGVAADIVHACSYFVISLLLARDVEPIFIIFFNGQTHTAELNGHQIDFLFAKLVVVDIVGSHCQLDLAVGLGNGLVQRDGQFVNGGDDDGWGHADLVVEL